MLYLNQTHFSSYFSCKIETERTKPPYLLLFDSVAESVSSFSLVLLQIFHKKSKLANFNSNEVMSVLFFQIHFFSLYTIH